MKIAITGKGGVGKTSIAAALAFIFKKQGKKVIAIDADPDANLGTSLGFSKEERPEPISTLKKVILERTGEVGSFFKLNPKVDDIPDRFSKEKNNIKLLEMGTVKKGGAGCVCPESAFLKALLSHIFLNRDEVVIVDMEAGIEHLGRGTAQAVDKFIIVVEPSLTSLSTANKIKELAESLKIKETIIIGNKIRDDNDKVFLQNNDLNLKIDCFLKLDNSILSSRGKIPQDSPFVKDLEEVFNAIKIN
ncbi:MAG: AAA family ATPase [Candidatus Omnitrophota bacterium]